MEQFIGLFDSGKFPYFRDLAAVKILAALMGAEYQNTQNLRKMNIQVLAKSAVNAAEALEKELERSHED
jgi:hypothetical protein